MGTPREGALLSTASGTWWHTELGSKRSEKEVVPEIVEMFLMPIDFIVQSASLRNQEEIKKGAKIKLK